MDYFKDSDFAMLWRFRRLLVKLACCYELVKKILDILKEKLFRNWDVERVFLKNLLLEGVEGGFTRNFATDGTQSTIYEASVAYQSAGTPLVILAGKEYGSGSSRDWAAKGTALLGVRAVIAESFERIHRSNLIGMGVLPLQFKNGESAQSLGLTGEEVFSISGITALNTGGVPKELTVTAGNNSFAATVRIDTPGEADYYRHGGIMQYVLRSLLNA